MKVITSVEARMGSSRLPGKTLASINGVPMLRVIVERLRPAKGVDDIVVATSDSPENDVLEELCQALGVHCFRGDENDVRARVLCAAKAHGADVLVKLTGDNPLVDHYLTEAMLERFFTMDCDLLTNGAMEYSRNWSEPRTFPIGCNIQVLKRSVLEDTARRFPSSRFKEHVTLDILAHPELYRLEPFHARGDWAPLHHPEWRFTVDTEADLAFVRAVFQELGEGDLSFRLLEVAELLNRRPDLAAINAGTRQHNPLKSGWEKA